MKKKEVIMRESFLAKMVRATALRRIDVTKEALDKEYSWFKELSDRDKFYFALQVFGAEKAILQMWRILGGLVPTVLSIVAIVLAFWKAQ